MSKEFPVEHPEETTTDVAPVERRPSETERPIPTPRRELEAEWGEAEEASTESLRLALQRYRALFERLLAS